MGDLQQLKKKGRLLSRKGVNCARQTNKFDDIRRIQTSEYSKLRECAEVCGKPLISIIGTARTR